MKKLNWNDTDKRAFVSGILKVTVLSVAAILVWKFVDIKMQSELVTGSWDVTMRGKHGGTLYSYLRREDVFLYYVLMAGYALMANALVLPVLMGVIKLNKPVWIRLVDVCLYGVRYVRRSDVAHVTVVREEDGTRNIVRSGWIIGKNSKRMRRFVVLSQKWRRASDLIFVMGDSKVCCSYRVEQPLLLFISDDDAKNIYNYVSIIRGKRNLDFSLRVWIEGNLIKILRSGGTLIGTHLMTIDEGQFDCHGLNMATREATVSVTVRNVRIRTRDA